MRLLFACNKMQRHHDDEDRQEKQAFKKEEEEKKEAETVSANPVQPKTRSALY